MLATAECAPHGSLRSSSPPQPLCDTEVGVASCWACKSRCCCMLGYRLCGTDAVFPKSRNTFEPDNRYRKLMCERLLQDLPEADRDGWAADFSDILRSRGTKMLVVTVTTGLQDALCFCRTRSEACGDCEQCLCCQLLRLAVLEWISGSQFVQIAL